MGTDVWRVDRLDLDGYLERIGVAARPPSRAALDELYEAHVRRFTFDNLDVLLEAHPGVDLDAVQAKFVGRGRGGYCFEHATLLAAALERLGYAVERRLARVGDVDVAPRTHAVVLVDVDGERVLADPGFGMSVLRPITLADGAEEAYGGWAYRLARVETPQSGPAWELHRHRDGAWELMHTTDDLPVRPVDLALGHHWTSTHPTTHFRHGLMVTRFGDGVHTTVTHQALTVRRPGEPTEHRPLEDDELAHWLRELAVPLTRDETARLLEVAERLRTGG